MADQHERREHVRVPGPFDGYRMGGLDTPVRICDLSEGGCFIDSMHDAPAPGTMLDLRIQLPTDEWITVRGRALYPKPGFGFACQFVDISPDDRSRLEGALAARLDSARR